MQSESDRKPRRKPALQRRPAQGDAKKRHGPERLAPGELSPLPLAETSPLLLDASIDPHPGIGGILSDPPEKEHRRKVRKLRSSGV